MLIKFHSFRPNIAVKGTHRTRALVVFGRFFGFADFVNLCQPARPLLLRYM
jgi:hypothetical protein